MIYLANLHVSGIVESAAAVARLTNAAETSLAVVLAVMVYGNWIEDLLEVLMLLAALLLYVTTAAVGSLI